MNVYKILKDSKYPVDYCRIGPLLDRMAYSRYLVHQLTSEATKLKLEDSSAICIFGSAARGEFDLRYSDVDLMFFGFDEEARNKCLRNLIEHNQCFEFHDALEFLIADNADARAVLNRRFPCVDRDTLLGTDEASRRRRIQFFTESIPCSGATLHTNMLAEIVEFYHLVPKSKLYQTPQHFFNDYDTYFTTLTNGVTGEREKDADYFVKFLAVRDIGQHFVRLGIVQAIRSKKEIVEGHNPAVKFAQMCRQPPLLKLSYWVSPAFLAKATIIRLVEGYSKQLEAAVRQSLGDGFPRHLREDPFDLEGLLASIIQSAAESYCNTLELFHEPASRQHLAKAATNFVNWSHDPQLKEVGHQIAKTIKHLLQLGIVLKAIYTLAHEVGVMNKRYPESGLECAIDSLCGNAMKSLQAF